MKILDRLSRNIGNRFGCEKLIPEDSLYFAVMQQKVLMVVGGGAAGFFCAVNAARNAKNLKVVVLEKSNKLLAKLKISGGGRCNVTNGCFEVSALVKNYPRGEKFLKKSFAGFSPKDTIQWFAERGVQLKEEPDGRIFPVTDDSSTIANCLLNEAQRYGVEILLQQEVRKLHYLKEGGFQLVTQHQAFRADYMVIACGGLPKASMFEWLKDSGHTIVSPVPSLFTFNLPRNPVTKLMGLSVKEASLKVAGSKLEQKGALLITHWGLSGPAVLRLSAWGAREFAEKQWNFTIRVNWIPAYEENSARGYILQYRQEKATQKLENKNPFGLPQRLWEFLLEEAGISEAIRWGDLPAKNQNLLVKLLCSHEFTVQGKTGFKEEFVTAGGINLAEIEPSTMMSRLRPGLFFAGEIMDVDGITGGFNFQHAWTSGYLAAQKIVACSLTA